jgi:hypothetical protein
MSQGSVARKRYRGMDHRGDLIALGEDCTIGPQNKRPATRKVTSSKICIHWERMPN